MKILEVLWNIFTNPLFYKLTLTASTPLLFASLGGVFSEITGVVNIALEGIMLLGAFSSVVITYYTGNVWLGFCYPFQSVLVFPGSMPGPVLSGEGIK